MKMRSNMLLLKNDGRLIWSQDYGGEKREVSGFMPFVAENLEIEEGTTFETFFIHLMKEKDKYSEFFASQLGHYDLSVFDEEWQKPFYQDADEKLSGLEVYWGIDYNSKWGNELQEMPCFQGLGEPDEHGCQMYAIEFTPINKFKALPLKLNTNYKIEDTSDVRNPKVLFEGAKAFTVYDVISAILYEITFCGSPQKRDEQLKEIIRSKDEIDRGEAKLIKMEDVKSLLNRKGNTESETEQTRNLS